MFRVLNQLPKSTSGIQPVAQHGYLVKEVHRNLTAVQSHYQSFTFTVNSDHLLYKLLAALPISFSESVQNYYDRLVDGTPELANRVKLTTERYSGQLFNSEFYPDLHECVIAHGESRLLTREFLSNWRMWSPVRIIDHPFTDLRYLPLHPKKASTGHGFATIYIDVPLLALQYRMWALAMSYVEDGQLRVKEPMMSFLASFPLVNALWSHNDVVFRNNCFGADVTQRLMSSPNNVTNQDNLLLQVAVTTRATLLKRQRTYGDMLRQTLAFNVDQFNATRLPFIGDMRQTRWARDIGCLRLWRQLIETAEVSESLSRNGQENNDLRRAMERTLNEGTWTAAPLPSDLRKFFINDVTQLLDLLNKAI